MQNLSPWENLMKLRSILLYGKAVIDEKTHEFKLPVQVYDFFFKSKENNSSDLKKIILVLLKRFLLI
jgi:hypothetical protein